MPIDCRMDIFALGKILEYDFPRRYNWLAKRCAKQNLEQRPDNAANVQALLHRHHQLRQTGWIVLVLALILLGTLFVVLFQLNKPNAPHKIPNEKPVSQEQPVSNQSQVNPIEEMEENVPETAKTNSNNLDAKLKKQLDQEMYKRFHPLMQDIKNHKYAWQDESELVLINTVHFMYRDVLKTVLEQAPSSSKTRESCTAYYIYLYNRYFDSVTTLNKQLPSYTEQSMDLIQKLSDKKISVEEYQQQMDLLGPDPQMNWTYNQQTELWEKKKTK